MHWDSDGPGPAIAFKEYEAAARGFKLELRSLPIRGPNPDFAGAFQTAKTARLDALMVVTDPLMRQHWPEACDLAREWLRKQVRLRWADEHIAQARAMCDAIDRHWDLYAR